MQSQKEKLKEKEIEADELVMMFLPGGDVMLGSVRHFDDLFEEKVVEVTNPKRIIRTQFRTNDGQMGISFGMGDYDLLGPGSLMNVRPATFAVLKVQPLAVQEAYLGLYLQHLEQRAQASAMAAGLALPKSPIIPGR